MRNALSVISGVLFFVAYVPYIRAILNRKATPSKASWIIWASIDIITVAGMFAKHTLNGQIIGAALGSVMVAFLTLKYGEPGWTKLDKFCLFGALLGIVLWLTFDNPVLAIMTSMTMVFIGGIPTLKSAWRDTNNEDPVAWTLFWLSCVVAMFAIPRWTLADAAQPITFTVFETIMMYLLFIRPRFHRQITQ